MNPEMQEERTPSEEYALQFEEFLHEYYSEQVNPTCLDDMLPDCTADWIESLDVRELIELTGKFVSKIKPI